MNQTKIYTILGLCMMTFSLTFGLMKLSNIIINYFSSWIWTGFYIDPELSGFLWLWGIIATGLVGFIIWMDFGN